LRIQFFVEFIQGGSVQWNTNLNGVKRRERFFLERREEREITIDDDRCVVNDETAIVAAGIPPRRNERSICVIEGKRKKRSLETVC
jgi:hypothetical protein